MNDYKPLRDSAPGGWVGGRSVGWLVRQSVITQEIFLLKGKP